jgi:hypothetical protein
MGGAGSIELPNAKTVTGYFNTRDKPEAFPLLFV